MNIKTNFLIVSFLGVVSSAAWGAPTAGFVRCASRGIVADGDGNIGPVSCQLLAYRDPQKGQGSVGVFSNDCPASITVTPSLGGATIAGNGGEDFNKCSIVLKAADSNGAFSAQTPAETILINNLSNALVMIAPDAVSGYEGAPINFTAALMKMKPGGREAISGGTWTCSAVNPYGESVSCASIGASVTTSGAFSWTPGPSMERSWQFTIGAKFPRSKPYSKTITVQVRDLDPPAYVYLTLPKPGPAPAVNRRAKWNITGKCAYPGDPVKISGVVTGTAECRADKTFGAVFNLSSYDFSGTSHPLIVSHGHQTFTAIAHYKNIFADTTYSVEPTQSPATVAVEGGGTAYAGSYLNCSVDPAANPSINHIYYILEWTGVKGAQVNIDGANAVKSRYQVTAADLGATLGCRYQAFKRYDPEFLKLRSLASATVAPEEFTVEQLPEQIQPQIQADVASAKSTVTSNPNLTTQQKSTLTLLIDQKTKEAIQIGNPNGGKPQVAKELVAITSNAVQACNNCNAAQVEKAASIAPSLAKQITPTESQAVTDAKVADINQIATNYTEIVNAANSAPQSEQPAQQAVVESVNKLILEASSTQPAPSNNGGGGSPTSNPDIVGAVASSIEAIAEVQSNPPASEPPPGFTEIPQEQPTAEEQADPCHYEEKCHGSGWMRYCEPPPLDKLACKLAAAVESAGEEIERAGERAGEAAVEAREAAAAVAEVIIDQTGRITEPTTPGDLRDAVVSAVGHTADAIRSVGSSENKIAVAEAARDLGNSIAPVFTAADTWMRENAPYILAIPYRALSDGVRILKKYGPEVLNDGAEFLAKSAEVTGDKITACLADESHCDPRPTVLMEKMIEAGQKIGDAVYTNMVILDKQLVAFDEERVAFMNMVSQALDAAVADEDEARIWQGIEKFAATSGGKMAISWRKAYTTIKEDYPELKDELVDTWHHILDMTPQLRDQAVAGIIWYSENIPNTWWYGQIASLGDTEHKDMYDKMWTHWSDVAAVIDAKTLPQREAMGQWLEQQGRVTLVNIINGYNYVKDKGPSWAEAAGDFLAQYDPGPGLAHIGRVLGRAAEMGAECTVNYVRQGECETLDAIAKGALHAKDVIDNYVTTEKLLKATDAAIDMASEFGEQVCDPDCQKRNLKATQDFMQAVSDRASEGWNDALDAAYNYYQYVKAGGLADEWADFSDMAAIIYESALPPETQKQIFQNLKGWMESVPGKAKAAGTKFSAVAKKYYEECINNKINCGGDTDAVEKLKAAGRKAAELYHQAQQNPVLMAAADAIKEGWQVLADGATEQGEFVVAYLDCIIRPVNKAEQCLDGLKKAKAAADPADRLAIMQSVDSAVATYGSASAGDIAAVDEMIVASSSASDFAAVETIAEARQNAPSVAVSAKVSDLMTATTAGTTTPTQIQAAAAGASVAVSAPSLSDAQRNAVLDDAVAVMNWSKSNASIAAPALAALSSSTTPANVASAKAMTLTSCSYNGQTILNTLTASRTRYQSAEVPEGSSCVSETQTAVCSEGTLGSFSGTYANSSCVVIIGCQGGLPKVAKYKDDDGDGFRVPNGQVDCPEAPGFNTPTVPADNNDAVAITAWNAVKRNIMRVTPGTPRSDDGTTLYYNGDYNSSNAVGFDTWVHNDVYMIANINQFKHFQKDCTFYSGGLACGGKVLLLNDITFDQNSCTAGSFGTWNSTLNTCVITTWNTVASDGTFSGIFNGDGHTIRNLSVNTSGQAGTRGGLFAKTGAGAVINNLTLEGGYVISHWKMGGVVGAVTGSTLIHRVVNKNQVLVEMGCADCPAYAGGLVGIAVTGLRVVESANFGKVSKYLNSSTANMVGGLIGEASADTQVYRSFNAGQVDGNKYTGGLVGNSATGFYYDVYNSGSVTATGIKWNGTLDTTNLARVGGLIGSGAFQMSRGFNYGSVVSPSTGRGIFLGYDAGIGVGDVYGLAYPGVTNAATFMTAQPTGSGSGMTAAQLMNTANFSIAPAQSWGFNLTTTWNIDANSFMYFRWFNYGACGTATAKPGCQ